MSPNGVSEGVMQVVVHISPPSTGTPYIKNRGSRTYLPKHFEVMAGLDRI